MNYPQQIDFDHLTDSDMELLDVEKVAKMCDLSIPTVYRKVRLGQFPAPTRQGSGVTRWMRCQIRAYKRELLRNAITAA